MLAACERCGDRFLFTVLAEIGLWIDEALGLRHNDIDVAAWAVTVSTRVNLDGARAKSGSRQIPVSAIPCSSNLWAEPVGAPMSYRSVHDPVLRLRERSGVVFSPHVFRHSYATRACCGCARPTSMTGIRPGCPAEVQRISTASSSMTPGR